MGDVEAIERCVTGGCGARSEPLECRMVDTDVV